MLVLKVNEAKVFVKNLLKRQYYLRNYKKLKKFKLL